MSFNYTKTRQWRVDLEINENNLEDEWMTQASKYMYYSEEYAEKIKLRDIAKQNLERIEAELDNYCLSNWAKFFEKSPSDKVRANYVISQEKYQKALAILIEANYKVNLLSKAVNAFEHRKKALEEVVKLKLRGYYSEPTIKTEDIKEAHLGLKKRTVKRTIKRNQN